MSFKLTHQLPSRCLVAVSGGVDSMVALHWLSQKAGRVQGIVHVHHNTGKFADCANKLVLSTSQKMNIPIFSRRLNREPESGHSPEAWWREQRYRFFKEISAVNQNLPIVLAHHLDDCLEEYVMCTMVRGFLGTIPYQHGPCIRPFRLWSKADIVRYAQQHNVAFLDDPTNSDPRFKRNYIRLEIADDLRCLNPGIYNIVEKVIREQDKEESGSDTHKVCLSYKMF